MRTKLFTLIAAIAFTFGATNVFADEGKGGTTPVVTKEGKVNLTIELNPIHSIEVNSGQETVNLVYSTAKDYEEGVTSTNKDHLKVISTGGYTIQVKATDFIYTNGYKEGMNKIGLSHITLLTSGSEDNKTYTELNGGEGSSLSNESKTIVASTYGGFNEVFNVTYGAQGSYEYLKNNYVNGETVNLNTTVTYTLVPN